MCYSVRLTFVGALRSTVKRRTLLAGAGGVSVFGLAGYLIYEMTLSLPILVIVENETDAERNVAIRAVELGTDREMFDAAFNAPVDSTATPGRIPNDDAQVLVQVMEPAAEVAEADDDHDGDDVAFEATTLIGADTKQLFVTITDDGVELEQEYR